jgi:hypothetical protein
MSPKSRKVHNDLDGRNEVTRINVVPVSELCDQHLLAEFRELTRIPNCVLSGKLKTNYKDMPADYVLGPGHVKFFVNKLGWLEQRYDELYRECVARGFNVTKIFPSDELRNSKISINGWAVSDNAVRINRERIKVRMPQRPRWTVK